MDKKNITKHYSNADITVKWQSGLCTHSRLCFTGLIEVFNPAKHPWINMDGASTERIKEQVDKCPSGALTWSYNNAGKNVEDLNETAQAPVDIEFIPDGPVKINSPVILKDPQGKVNKPETPVYLCRCGGSKNKPFCDGTHKTSGFKG